MLKDEFVKLKTKGNRKLPYYRNLGYDVNCEEFFVKVNDLNSGSRQIVNVICDFCKKELSVTYKEYLRNIKIGNKYACSNLCGSEKAKETNLEKYGVINALQLKEVQYKQKKTNLERYGVEFLQQSEKIKEKSRKKIIEKYGVSHISMVEELRKKNTFISKDEDYIKYVSDNRSLLFCQSCNNTYSIKNDNYYHRKNQGLSTCTLCNPIGNLSSLKERQLKDYIKSIYDGCIIENYRDSFEIDIFIPDLKIGFEFNGLFWHSEEHKDKNYHLEKTTFFEKKGIRIIHIWEDDWIHKSDLLKSQIKNWLGITERKIYARKCQVKEINKKISTHFLKKNHIQGSDKSILRIGLYYGDELVSIMTFDHFEGRKKMENGGWNLSRFCNISGSCVVGGASKLFTFFIEKYYPSRVISYADKTWSQGNLYHKLNFYKVSESSPDYKYIVNGIRRHKSGYRKGILKTNLSEGMEMKKRNVPKIWDCGKIKFEKKINI